MPSIIPMNYFTKEQLELYQVLQDICNKNNLGRKFFLPEIFIEIYNAAKYNVKSHKYSIGLEKLTPWIELEGKNFYWIYFIHGQPTVVNKTTLSRKLADLYEKI